MDIGRCVNVHEGKISGLKSHYCHVLIQWLLPIMIRGYHNDEVWMAITETYLCSWTLKIHVLRRLQSGISLAMCRLERIFPPAFFTIMVHLMVHLPREALLGRPIQYHWMYPTE